MIDNRADEVYLVSVGGLSKQFPRYSEVYRESLYEVKGTKSGKEKIWVDNAQLMSKAEWERFQASKSEGKLVWSGSKDDVKFIREAPMQGVDAAGRTHFVEQPTQAPLDDDRVVSEKPPKKAF